MQIENEFSNKSMNPEYPTIRIPTPGGFASYKESSVTMTTSSQANPITSRIQQDHDSSFLLPDLVSTTSFSGASSDEDESSDVSSLSSVNSEENNDHHVLEEEEPESPRSIFKCYWNRTGESPLSLRSQQEEPRRTNNAPPLPTLPPLDWNLENDQAKDNTYERTLNRQEGVVKERRTIFDVFGWHQQWLFQ